MKPIMPKLATVTFLVTTNLSIAADDTPEPGRVVANTCSQAAQINTLNQQEEHRIRTILAEAELTAEDRALLSDMLDEYESVNHRQKRMFERYCLDGDRHRGPNYVESGHSAHVNRVGAERN